MILRKFTWAYILPSLALLYGCSTQAEKTAGKEIPTLPVTQLITKDTVLHQDYVADIQALKHVEVRAKVSGYLEKIYVDEGKEVKQGQPLFKISSEEYRAELAKADANLKKVLSEAVTAEVELERVKTLVENKVISKSELEMAKANLKAAKARIEEARSAKNNAATKLSYTYVKAPFSGIIDRIPLKQGSLINAGTLLTSISDLQSVYAYFNVSEKEYLAYSKAKQNGTNNRSKTVKLVLADGSDYPLTGQIETMDGEFEANTGSIAFRAKFPNPDKLLKHHSSGKVKLFREVEDALMLPQKATFEVQDKSFVYVVNANNKVAIRSFTPKARFSQFYIVDSGLEPGDKVVYEGFQGLKEGTAIKMEEVPMDSLMARSNP